MSFWRIVKRDLKIMNKPIPGFGPLRVFESAARHLSFTQAAAELNVTPAAVSHQIGELEAQFGFRLFVRTSRKVRLSEEGEILQRAVGESMDVLRAALGRIRKLKNKRQLRLTASPSIAAKWLVPRLDRFLSLVPNTDVRIEVGITAVDFEREEVDVAIRFGSGDYPGFRITRLFEDTVFPVCSPALLSGKKPLRQPRDLLQHNLIHVEWHAQGATWPNWRMWMTAAGVTDFDDRGGLHFGHSSLAIEAALNGQGVVLGETSLVADDLAAGRLVQPFAVELKGPPRFAYYLISPEKRADEDMVRLFREWAVKEAVETERNRAG
jgi:LysR family glycine cleavage system transcriptional activator